MREVDPDGGAKPVHGYRIQLSRVHRQSPVVSPLRKIEFRRIGKITGLDCGSVPREPERASGPIWYLKFIPRNTHTSFRRPFGRQNAACYHPLGRTRGGKAYHARPRCERSRWWAPHTHEMNIDTRKGV